MLSMKSDTAVMAGARVAPMLFRGAVNPVHAPDGDVGSILYPGDQPAPVVAPVADPVVPPAAVADPVVPPVADPVVPPVVVPPVANPAVVPPVVVEKTAEELAAETAAAEAVTAEADAAKQAAKDARAAELAAMTPEKRAEAEAADAAAAKDEAEAVRLASVPEDGVYALTMPEGVELDTTLLAALAPDFKDLFLTNGQAQGLADKFIAVSQARAVEEANAWANTVAGWVDTAKADPEMGGVGGVKWEATAKAASSVTSRFGTPALAEYLNASGGGNHPEMIRLFAKLGALIGEDTPIVPEAPGAAVAKDTASVMYPNDLPKGK